MTFQKWLEENCYETRAYSGRGMYGKECLAVTVSDVSAMWTMAMMLQEDLIEDEDLDFTGPFPPRYDSMGLGVILYWPSIPYENT